MKTSYMLRHFAAGVSFAIGACTAQAQVPVIIPCNGDSLVDTYCYTNNDGQVWYWQSECYAPVILEFLSGTIESGTFDYLRIFDGQDNVAPLLWQNASGPDNVDLTGIALVSSSGSLYMELLSDSTNCCATDGVGLRDFTSVPWTWTVKSTVTTGMATEQDARFTMWPNPASEVVNISMLGRMNGTVQVVDVSGRTVLQDRFLPNGPNGYALHLGGLRDGLYSVKLITPNGTVKTQSLQIVH